MSIEKKSLISNLKAAKKAIVASNPTVGTSTSETRSNLRKSPRSPLTRSTRQTSTRRASTRRASTRKTLRKA